MGNGLAVPKDFDAFYKNLPDVGPAQFLVDVTFLKNQRRFADMEAAVTGYLKYHGKHALPWMYETLGTAIVANKGDFSRARTAFGWAAYLARQSKDPVELIAACDTLLQHKLYEVPLPGKSPIQLGEMLDLAMDAAPHRAEPILMSMAMAEQVKDGRRMAVTIDRLLSLGWPGVDELWRVGSHERANELAKVLTEDGKTDDAKSLLASLPAAEARDVVVRLSWTGEAGLGLSVDESLGATANYKCPRTVFGGTIVKEGRGRDRESIYTCPRAFDGEYAVRVETLYNDQKAPVHNCKVEVITHEGAPEERKQHFTVDLADPRPVKFTLSGGRRVSVLPYDSLPRALPDRDEMKPKPVPAKPKEAKSPANPAKPKG